MPSAGFSPTFAGSRQALRKFWGVFVVSLEVLTSFRVIDVG
jgi:hypothetical protein